MTGRCLCGTVRFEVDGPFETVSQCHCTSCKKYGQLAPCHPSPFLKELPAELVEHANERSKEPVTQDAGKDLFATMRSALE